MINHCFQSQLSLEGVKMSQYSLIVCTSLVLQWSNSLTCIGNELWLSILNLVQCTTSGNLLVSEYSWNCPCLLGRCKTGGLCSLCLILSKAFCCSSPQINCLPFLVRSYIGFKSLWKFRVENTDKIHHTHKTSTTFDCSWRL